MATDRARNSYDATRMYRAVVSQQGRVTVEADANEAEEIRGEESRAQLIDVVGPTGSPDDGFKISIPGPSAPAPAEKNEKVFRRMLSEPIAASDPFDFAIGEGTLYVGGMRVRCTASQATYSRQRKTEWVDFPAGNVDAHVKDPP